MHYQRRSFHYWARLLLFLQLLLVPHSLSDSDPGDEAPLELLESLYEEQLAEEPNHEDLLRNAVNRPHKLWPSTTVYYRIADDYTPAEVRNVQKAVGFFNRNTCVQFVPYNAATHAGKPYIFYKSSPKLCGTLVGYSPRGSDRAHEVVLGPKCRATVGIIQHETLHVLGLYHEQSRPDRNDYVKVDFSNIATQYWPQFAVLPHYEATTLDVPYDYESIMHYSKNAFARNPAKPTILARDGNRIWERDMGQTQAPSEGDLLKIHIMYKCKRGLRRFWKRF